VLWENLAAQQSPLDTGHELRLSTTHIQSHRASSKADQLLPDGPAGTKNRRNARKRMAVAHRAYQ
jgi:hypothetical protein